MIYFIQAGKNGPIKIGYTDNDVESRLKQLQTANPYKLKLLWYINGSQQDESEIHQKFSHENIRGEWFHPSMKLLNFINNDATNDWSIPVGVDGCDEIYISESKKEIFVNKDGWGITEQKEKYEVFLSTEGCYSVRIDSLINAKTRTTIRQNGMRIESIQWPYIFVDIALGGETEFVRD